MADILTPPSASPYPGVTITDGSPIMIVPKVINAAWNKGLDMQAAYQAEIDAATGASGFLTTSAAPHVTAGSVTVPTVTAPGVTIPTTIDASGVLSTFSSQYATLVTLLSDKFTLFRSTYFPNEAATYAAAESWIAAAIANPDSGVPLTVQTQIWEDDRSRILADATRASDAVIAQFAARRFPLPPDAASSAVLRIQQNAQDEMAASSRKVAILSVENMKFVIEKAINLRTVALDEAVKYVAALASGPQMASQVVGLGYDAQSKLISAASQYYAADTGAKEMVSKVAQFNASLALDAATKNQTSDLALVENKLKALLSEAQALAQMAASLFNNLHVQAGVSNTSSFTQSQDLTV